MSPFDQWIGSWKGAVGGCIVAALISGALMWYICSVSEVPENDPEKAEEAEEAAKTEEPPKAEDPPQDGEASGSG
ncbi:hypothetical protein ACLX1H_001083 [Fusarium chlamydosporum]